MVFFFVIHFRSELLQQTLSSKEITRYTGITKYSVALVVMVFLHDVYPMRATMHSTHHLMIFYTVPVKNQQKCYLGLLQIFILHKR